MFITCLWCIKHNNDGDQTVRFFNIAAVVLAAAITLFAYISKWNALCSNKFKNYWISGVAIQIAKYLTHFQPSTCVNKNVNNNFFNAQFSSFKKTWQHPYKASRLWKHTDKHPQQVMKNCVKYRIDTILVSTGLLKHAKRINILIVLQYKSNKKLSKMCSIFWWYDYFIIFN